MLATSLTMAQVVDVTAAPEVVADHETQSLISVVHAEAVAVGLDVVGGGFIPPAFSDNLDDPEPYSSSGSSDDGDNSQQVSFPNTCLFSVLRANSVSLLNATLVWQC